MNRTVLKIVALVTMIIDHIGIVFFPDYPIFRIIGRLSYPIFAFFVAEGYYYTKSKKHYVIKLLLFAIASWIPYCLALNHQFYQFNVMATFLVSILGMFLIDGFRNKKGFFWLPCMCLYLLGIIALTIFEIDVQGVFGILVPIIFYALKDKKALKFIIASISLLLMACLPLLDGYNGFKDVVQFFALISIILLLKYNGKKGKCDLKYLFYISYPAHFIILYIIKLII